MSNSTLIGRTAELLNATGNSYPRIRVERQKAGDIFRVVTEGPMRYLVEIVDPKRSIANVFEYATDALHEASHISPIIEMCAPLEIRRIKTGMVLDVVQLPNAA